MPIRSEAVTLCPSLTSWTAFQHLQLSTRRPAAAGNCDRTCWPPGKVPASMGLTLSEHRSFAPLAVLCHHRRSCCRWICLCLHMSGSPRHDRSTFGRSSPPCRCHRRLHTLASSPQLPSTAAASSVSKQASKQVIQRMASRQMQVAVHVLVQGCMQLAAQSMAVSLCVL